MDVDRARRYTAEKGLASIASGTLCGFVTFPGTLAVIQFGVLKPLRLAAHLPLFATAAGLASTCIAGVTASFAFFAGVQLGSSDVSTLVTGNERSNGDLLNRVASWISQDDIIFYAASGAFGFRVMGGSFHRLCPSSLFHPGAFAYESITARRFIHASPREKAIVDSIGGRFGCHTCGGSAPGGKFVADHQPPSKLARNALDRMAFFPHCPSCSSQQGSKVAGASTRWFPPLLSHASSFRPYHIWLPIGPARPWTDMDPVSRGVLRESRINCQRLMGKNNFKRFSSL